MLEFKKLKDGIEGVKISLFVEADEEVMRKSIELGVDAVEIHTGHYAHDYLENGDISKHIKKFRSCFEIIESSSLTYHAGHGLTLDSVIPLLQEHIFEEYNIGHWIIAQSIFEGMGPVIEKFNKVFSDYPIKK